MLSCFYINPSNRVNIHFMIKMEQTHSHIVFVSFPAQGHVKPMLKLAELLNYAGSKITFVNTEYVHHHLLSSINIQAFQRRCPGFEFMSIPDGLPSQHPRSIELYIDLLNSIMTETQPAFRQLLLSLKQPPTCIIADGIMSCTTIDVAEELGIPVLAFRTQSACCTWIYFHLLKLMEEGQIPSQGAGGGKDMDKPVTCIPGLENIFRYQDLPSICKFGRDHPIFQYFLSQASAMSRASALILNTFEQLEKPMLSQLRSKFFHKTYTIGPLHGLSINYIKDNDPSPLASTKSILWKEDERCITWLDTQKPNSVLFVSFGSLIDFTHQHMLEFWHGLVNSCKPFLWAVRPESVTGYNGDTREALMGLESKTEGKGMIVSWAPQEEVLAHQAIGGFLTHSGWNSTLESIYAGVPMICWPVLADQPVNSRVVSDVWNIGFDMKDSCERAVIEKMVRDLMEDTKRRGEIMKSVDEIAKQARASVTEGGSSYYSLQSLIEDIN